MKVIVTDWKKIDDDWFKKEKIFDGKKAFQEFSDYLDEQSVVAGEKSRKVQATFFVGGIQK